MKNLENLEKDLKNDLKKDLKKEKPILVSFLVSGDPNIEATLKFMNALDEYCGVIELGIPFSDPIADGSTIQEANVRSLSNGYKIHQSFDVLREFRKFSDTPVVLMTYYNPIYKRGIENFVIQAKEAGANGLIIVDLPLDEAEQYRAICKKHDMGTVFLVAPNTPDERLMYSDEASTLFLYVISTFGITGARGSFEKMTFEFIARAKNLCDKNKLYVGFGISNGEHAEKIIENGADGVIVGSAFVDIIKEYGDSNETIYKLKELARELSEGIHKGYVKYNEKNKY
ncbi:tryptophan synthase alpha chain [Methanococcus voltae PS]|uniref:Tryptophan synthase alpha chain n=2 Tax=Methanococcus voltae TaxID=2188 RepID=TRPA_METVO|nr:tryptophan synthase subunit alpha [Methanococcus voltae]P14637.1 RecName: Full=Tryptophan synthase alpha chain [Methanococcus voltae]AAA72855.1 tryptophan synthase A [Methanococcus voltae PS]MCS3922894.1 tryptophan synthase alpha chain [Methanococcus voltae PS]